jgi:hypothetical protein
VEASDQRRNSPVYVSNCFGSLGWLRSLKPHFRYATEWFLTMYTRGFSFDLAARVWEIFLNEGDKIVYRVGLAILKVTVRYEGSGANFGTAA